MANKGGRKLSALRAGSRLHPEIDSLVDLIPALYYLVNRVLEDATPEFSKKTGIVLWVLDTATEVDASGRFLTTREIVEQFRKWSVVSESSASAEVSKVKSELLNRNYIMVAGGSDHIHLTAAGEKAVRQMRERAFSSLGERLKSVSKADRKQLLRIVGDLLAERPASAQGLSLIHI